jgi:SAM-dependent methyltransferase
MDGSGLPRVLREALGTAGLNRRALAAAASVPDRAVPGGLSLNRVCRPDVWDDADWMALYRALALPPGEARFHRKGFEWTHCVYGFERLGVLGPSCRALGVAAGHEPVLYYLANRTALTVGIDLYSGDFAAGGAEEAAPDILTDPERYAPFPYRREGLALLPADALRLPFRSKSFDVVFSLSSIEHFGGHAAAAHAVREMDRVLRPGGVACIATEYVLEGKDHHEFFNEAQLRDHVLAAAALVPVDQLDLRPPPRAFFDDPIRPPDVLRVPHIVIDVEGTFFTSVVLFLRKPTLSGWARLAGQAVARRASRR